MFNLVCFLIVKININFVIVKMFVKLIIKLMIGLLYRKEVELIIIK